MNFKRWQSDDGQVKITAIIESTGLKPGKLIQKTISAATPQAVRRIPHLCPHFATANGELLASIQGFVIETPHGITMVDTCVGNSKDILIDPEWSQQRSRFLSTLKKAGYNPEDINAVVCTHLHFDHIGWNTRKVDGVWTPTFPKAKYIFSEKEYQHWRDFPSSLPESVPLDRRKFAERYIGTLYEQSIKPVVDAGLVRFLSEDKIIAPMIRIIPTPGHTPDHFSVMIEHGRFKALITGDAIHHPCQIYRPKWGTNSDSDILQAIRSREELLKFCRDNQVLLLGTHFAGPVGGFVTRRGRGFGFTCEAV